MKTPHATYVGERPIDIVLIGGSAGVLDVLRVVLPGLPPSLQVPVVIVVHVPERSPALLPQVLRHAPPLPLKFAEDKEPLAGGTIYFAPAGYHLLLEANRCFALSIDPPVLFSRPSIDVLFESAADAYAGRVMAMLLTGASADGAAGLASIRAAGGVAVVQAPQTAEASTMPAAALALFDPDFVLSPPDIAALCASLAPQSRSAAWTRRPRSDA